MTTQTTRRPRRDAARDGGSVELLAAVLAGVPRLTGAACRGHVALFDAAADGDRQAAQGAVAICQRCPVIDRCAQWIADAHPRRPPPGVWAAQYQPPTTSRRKATNDRP
ncbi:WhiB family transcriptional regulator [Mycolicibacter kumamotonensis]|uniref:WhiB family transcriptional regulator n=1 Tax=Mycolicibacter kumamotonensis TaxID=354243 RepID=UPI0013F4DF12|nr:WhiB family transcriptional regulator [Mycolicibacter kumamotonensis]